MNDNKYNPDRDITEAYLATIKAWIEASREVLVVCRFLYGGGRKDFFLIYSFQEFEHRVERLPIGTDIIVFKEKNGFHCEDLLLPNLSRKR